MGKYERARQKIGYGVPNPGTVTPKDSVEYLIERSFDPDPIVRSAVAKHLCPCHVRTNVPEVWNRLLEMTADPEPVVRATSCTHSPTARRRTVRTKSPPLWSRSTTTRIHASERWFGR